MARKKKDTIKLSKKHGLQPTIPLCMYCGKAKNLIALLGAEGDKLAKSMGRPDGDMPKTAYIPGDIDPCDDCKSKAVMFVEVDGSTNMKLTGRYWGVKRDRLPSILNDEALVQRGLETGVMLISEQDAEAMGMHDIPTTPPEEDEQ